jgi:hypothetical protein
MRCLCLMGMWLAAVLAAACVASASASAEAPEFGRCIKQAHGKFKNGSCTTAAKPGEERYEWLPGVVNHGFTTASNTIVRMVSVSGDEILCTGESSPGRYAGTKSASMTLIFTACEFTHRLGEGIPCQSTGQPQGTIVTAALGGELGVVKRAKKAVSDQLGIELVTPSGTFMEFECSVVRFHVQGADIALVASNVMSRTLAITFAGEEPERFEGGPLAILEVSVDGDAYERFVLEFVITATNEERLEVSSVN